MMHELKKLEGLKVSNKKGLADQIIMLIVLLGALLFIILILFVWGMIAPPASQLLSESLSAINESTSTEGNLSKASEVFDNVNTGIGNLQWVSYGILLFLFIGFLSVAFFVRSFPFLIVVWLLFSVILVFISIFLAISYQEVSSTGELTGSYSDWKGNDFMLNYLPHIVTVFSLGGAFVLFILISRDQESEAVL